MNFLRCFCRHQLISQRASSTPPTSLGCTQAAIPDQWLQWMGGLPDGRVPIPNPNDEAGWRRGSIPVPYRTLRKNFRNLSRRKEEGESYLEKYSLQLFKVNLSGIFTNHTKVLCACNAIWFAREGDFDVPENVLFCSKKQTLLTGQQQTDLSIEKKNIELRLNLFMKLILFPVLFRSK